MSTCAKCSATPADFFSTAGDFICRWCFGAEQQRCADARAVASLAEQRKIEGVRYTTEPQSPKRVLTAGLVLMAAGFGPGVALLALAGSAEPWFFIVGLAGAASFARGLMQMRG